MNATRVIALTALGLAGVWAGVVTTSVVIGKEPAKAVVPAYELLADWPRLPESMKLGPVSAVATDSKDRVYVLQRAEPPLLAFESDGTFIRSWGAGLFKTPHGLRTDAENHVWATDIGRHVVIKFSPAGETLLTLGTKDQPGDGHDKFNRPADVAVAPSGEIYVADGYGNSRVVKFSKQGKFLQEWGRKGTAPGEFDLPHSIGLDAKGQVYVGDRENNRVQIFDAEGTFITQWKESGAPYGLYLHGDRAFIADGRAECVNLLDQHGKLLGRYRTGTGDAHSPHWVCVDRQGAMYVAYLGSQRVVKFTAK